MPTIKHARECVNVLFSRDEVKAFRRRWPASGLPVDSINIVLSTQDGGIVGFEPSRVTEADPDAVSAIVKDAQKAAHVPPYDPARPGRVPGLDGLDDARHAAWLGSINAARDTVTNAYPIG